MEQTPKSKTVTFGRIPWIDELFRATGKDIYGQELGPKGSRRLTQMVNAAILIFVAGSQELRHAALDAIEYSRNDQQKAVDSVAAALGKKPSGRKVKTKAGSRKGSKS